jgi:NUMOD4 motif/HNH endonuclease
MEDEIWKEIQEFADYQFSSLGRIKSFKTSKNGEILKLNLAKNGYVYTHLSINDKVISRTVHRLIAKAFLDNPNGYKLVNHKNGIKNDNRVENLEWCTASQNNKHMYDTLGRSHIRKLVANCDNTEINTNEVWKNIENFEYFQCSNLGNIKNFRFDNNGRLVKLYLNKSGYLCVSLYNYKTRKVHTTPVHRVVAEIFIPNPHNYPIVNHKNGIKIDNRIENLEWCTYAQNSYHYANVLGHNSAKGEKHGKSKLTETNIVDIVSLLNENKLTHKEIGEAFGVTEHQISRIEHGKRWKHLEYNINRTRVDLKLSDKEVLEIYKLSWEGKLSQYKIAQKYSISPSLVNLIKHGKNRNSITKHIKVVQ